jgi:type IV pilus assembly protein PilV
VKNEGINMIIKTFKRNPNDFGKGSQGFTLIEVLITITILSVGLLGMAALTTGIINGNKLSKDATTATVLAQEKIDEIRGREDRYSSIINENAATCQSPYDEFQREVAVSESAGMKTVTVTVSWGSHSRTLKTIFAN